MASSAPEREFVATPIVSPAPRGRALAGESLLVLTHDEELVRTLQACGKGREFAIVRAEPELAAGLLNGHVGVVILDAAAVAVPIHKLTERLKSQFPDLVLVVAGRLEHQGALGSQISDGTVYRFLHKPVSEQRVRLFVDAAWRRHGEEQAGIVAEANETAEVQALRPAFPRVVVISGALMLISLVATGGWLMSRRSDGALAASAVSTAAGASADIVSTDAELESLLDRAGKALKAGELVAPPEVNAADLYRLALHRNPSDRRAVRGLDQVIDRLLSAADVQLVAKHIDEAQRLTEQARTLKPEHVRVAFLTAQIGKARERALSAQTRVLSRNPGVEAASPGIIPHADSSANAPLDSRESVGQQKPGESVAAADLRKKAPEVDAEMIRHATPAEADSRNNPDEVASRDLRIGSAPAASAPTGSSTSTGSSASAGSLASTTASLPTANSNPAAVAIPNGAPTPVTASSPVSGAAPATNAPQTAAARSDRSGNPLTDTPANTQEPAQRAMQIAPSGTLQMTHYAPPIFPVVARERGVSGWVDVQFVVKSDGSVGDVLIVGAEPVGMFERAAMEAVRKWRYRPDIRNGRPVDQGTRLRLRFALQD